MAVKKVLMGEKPSDIQYNFTCKVGTTGDKPTDYDKGRPMKFSTGDTWVRCVDGDQMEGVLMSVENYTADGVTVGTVRSGHRFQEAIMVGTWAYGDFVVAAAQATNGTAYNDASKFPRPKVKTAARPDPATTLDFDFKWRIVGLVSGTALATGAVVTLERV